MGAALGATRPASPPQANNNVQDAAHDWVVHLARRQRACERHETKQAKHGLDFRPGRASIEIPFLESYLLLVGAPADATAGPLHLAAAAG